MTNQHPLTDKMCEDLMQRISKYPYTDDVIEDMRAAADWQLEQVKLEANKLMGDLLCIYGMQLEANAFEFYFNKLLKNLRPQEDNQ